MSQNALPKLNFPPYSFQVNRKEGGLYILDPIRRKWVALTPEEWVRQHTINYLVDHKGYPAGLTRIEASLSVHGFSKRCDVVVFDPDLRPLILVECKAPTIKLDEKAAWQIALYNARIQARVLLITNGLIHYAYAAGSDRQDVSPLDSLPTYDQIREVK